LGCTSITRRVLEQWDRDSIDMFNIDHRFGSHDLWFCWHARHKHGFNVFVDTGLRCTHLTETPIDLPDNQRWRRPAPN
jgi:hypothetical protein